MTNVQPAAESLHIVYSSRLASGSDHTAYADVCRVSRRRHVKDRVSGVLLFDGQRFCQWLQGEPEATRTVMRRIALDDRHAEITTWLHAPMPTCSFAQSWRSGFVDGDSLDRFLKLELDSPDHVLSAFGRLLATADIEPAVPFASYRNAAAGPATAPRIASGSA